MPFIRDRNARATSQQDRRRPADRRGGRGHRACPPSARRRAAPTSSSSTTPAGYRMAGRGSLAGLLAYGNANEIVIDMGREVLPVAKHTPVLAGVNGTDPFLIDALPARRCGRWVSPGCRTSRPSASSTASSGRTSRKRG